MRQVVFGLVICGSRLFAQQPEFLDLIDTADVRYVVDTANYYPGSENATWIIDYYYTDGISLGDRYAYEILIVDSLIMFAFSSPETPDLSYISFQKKTMLSEELQDSIGQVVLAAGLHQRRPGVPRPIASAHTQEVLVIRGPGLRISGGLFHLKSFENDTPEEVIAQEIARERRLTSSIAGDYDRVIALLRSTFPGLEKLIKEAKAD